jgi:hypothetical protein
MQQNKPKPIDKQPYQQPLLERQEQFRALVGQIGSFPVKPSSKLKSSLFLPDHETEA